MEDMHEDDPFEWDIQKVVGEVLKNPNPPWLEGSSSTSKLNHPLIISTFEENDVNGELLLTGIGQEELRGDLGVKSLGQRHTIIKAINYLQKRSQKYQQHLERFPPQQGFGPYFSPQTTYTNSERITQSPFHGSNVAYSVDSRAESPTSANEFHEARVASLQSARPPPPLFRNAPVVRESVEQGEGRILSPAHDNKISDDPEETGDGDAVVDLHHDLMLQRGTMDQLETPRLGETSNTSLKSRKRIAPSLIGPVGSYTNEQPPYSRMLIEDVFYPIEEVDEDRAFTCAERIPSRARQFVNSAMRYYLQHPAERLNGSSFFVRLPYPSRLTTRRSRLFTKFAPGAEPTKQSTSDWPIPETGRNALTSIRKPQNERSPSPMTETEGRKEDEKDVYFDALLEKYPPNDVTIIEFDNDSEGGVSLDDETWAEIQQEAAEGRHQSSLYLSIDDINHIVDDEIQRYIENWKVLKLPKYKMKAFKLWKRVTVLGRRSKERSATESQISFLTRKIQVGRSEIAMHSWNKEADLRFQCQSLQEHVNQREEAHHLFDVLSSSNPPPRPEVTRLEKQPIVHEDLAEGEEVLDSESDVSLDDFLVRDEERQLVVHDADMADDEMEDAELIGPPQAEQPSTIPEGEETDEPLQGIVDDDAMLSDAGVQEPQSSSDTDGRPLTGSDQDLDDLPIMLPDTKYKQRGNVETSPILLSSDPAVPDAEDSIELQSITSNGNDDDLSEAPRRVLSTPRQGQQASQSLSAKSHSPDLDDFQGIQALSFSYLEKRSDRKRLLVKLIAEVEDAVLRRLREYIRDCSTQTELGDGIRTGIEEITNESRSSSVTEIDDFKEIFTTQLLLARLYISYDLCKAFTDWSDIPQAVVRRFSRKLAALKTFSDLLRTVLKKLLEVKKHKHLIRRTKEPAFSSADMDGEGLEIPEGSDQDMLTALTGTPHKKRKRAVKESQQALEWQEMDQKRLKDYERRKMAVITSATSANENSSPAISYSGSVPIRLDPHIGSRVKPHQVAGIEFIWREIVDNDKQQGCLLAHTMGLGKTMQVISFLSTLNQSTESEDPEIRKQVPKHLKRSQTLVLAPASLALNWVDEFAIWAPPTANLGPVRNFTGSNAGERIRTLAAWAEDGGILISGYEIFRDMVLKKPSAMTDDQHDEIKNQLLSANIIVADEAHRMKNIQGKLFRVASHFPSTSRIALTGSPLANNLDEYYTMIQWVAPQYLGTLVQFKAKYSEPIAQGLYQDSTPAEKRTSLRRLHLLKKNLEPKTNRADISAIAADMPQKTEFYLTVALTEVQKKAYNIFIDGMVGSRDVDKLSNTKVFSWLSWLSLLCIHPTAFAKKIIAAKDHRAKEQQSDLPAADSPPLDGQDDPVNLPPDQQISYSDVPSEMLEEELAYFEEISNPHDLAHSVRAILIDIIIRQSIAAGDKVLLFSHTLTALDFYEKLMRLRKVSYARLDGQTKVSTRQQATKQFNAQNNKTMVYLISTRAGGLGLNLYGANRVIIVDFGFNPTWEEQAIGRAYRLGQTKHVFVYRFKTGGTFEEIINNKAVFKTQLSARVVDNKSWASNASKKAKDYLFPPREVEQKDLSEYYGKDGKVLDVMLDGEHGIRNIELTETFQREDDEALTPEELKQVQQELDDEKLEREDPVAYHQMMSERRRVEIEQRHAAYLQAQRAMTNRMSYMGSTLAASLTLGYSNAGSATELTKRGEQPSGVYSNTSFLRDAGETPTQLIEQLEDRRAPTPDLTTIETRVGVSEAARPRASSDAANIPTPTKPPGQLSLDGAADDHNPKELSLPPHNPPTGPQTTSNNTEALHIEGPQSVKEEHRSSPMVNWSTNIIELSSDTDVTPPVKKQKTQQVLGQESQKPSSRLDKPSSPDTQGSPKIRIKEKPDCTAQ